MVVNQGKYAVSNSLLAGYIKPYITAEQLVCMWYNSLTLLSIELNVHSLGGGVLVLIPGETDKLEIVNAISQEDAESVFKEIDNCIKEKGLQAAYQLGDELVLSKIYKLSDQQIQQIRDSAIDAQILEAAERPKKYKEEVSYCSPLLNLIKYVPVVVRVYQLVKERFHSQRFFGC